MGFEGVHISRTCFPDDNLHAHLRNGRMRGLANATVGSTDIATADHAHVLSIPMFSEKRLIEFDIHAVSSRDETIQYSESKFCYCIVIVCFMHMPE